MTEENGDAVPLPIFDSCNISIIVSKELPVTQARQFREILEDNGASAEIKKPDDGINVEEITHIVSTTTDFACYDKAGLLLVPVVTPSWVTQSLSKRKQVPIRPFTPDERLIFSNVNLTCADIPQGDKDAIIGATLAMGGMESNSLTKLVTHICALSMDHPKCQQAKEKGLKCKIVLPHWFDDCLKLGKRIDERPYLLPNPEIGRMKPEDNLPIPSSAGLEGATAAHPDMLDTPTASPIQRNLDVFKGKNVMLSEDLDIGSRLTKLLTQLIECGQGTMTPSVRKADIFVCNYREGRNYVIASRSPSTHVGNLSWLYYMIAHNEWTNPTRRLLHYPMPKGGLPGFENYKITLSNYGGEARIYLENLVNAAGGEFTKSMKQDNTHLITARKSSEKCNAADAWNIDMVNHLWLEESYAKCEVQRLTDPRYIHFPPRTNLGEVIGQTQFDLKALEKKYFPTDPTPGPNSPKSSKMNNLTIRDRDGDHNMDGETDDEEAGVFAPPPKPKARGKRISTASTNVNSTPATKKRTSLGKENDTPSSTNSRSAKDRALNAIHDLAPDIAQYELEKKRKGHVFGGDRAANRIEKERELQRNSSPIAKHQDNDEDSDSESDETDIRPVKKAKTTSKPEVQVRMLVTGYKKKLRNLGIAVWNNYGTVNIMAAPKMVRTRKFLVGLAHGPTVVSDKYIEACIKAGKMLDVEDFPLKDTENEQRHKVKLKDAVTRARANKGRLLNSVPIYCTADIDNGVETHKAIAEANGATFGVYKGRPTIKPTKPEEDEGPPEPVYLISSDKKSEQALYSKFEEMAKAGNMLPRIVKVEWLLDVAMSQQMKWDKNYLLKR
ncbi:regulator of Ty1 Transposition [Ciborinia camelliae]|nr:regulator of Ty1 Transposition [Ciborinia camelliae]